MPRKSSSTAKAKAKAMQKPAPKPAKKGVREQTLPIDELSEWVQGILPKTVIVRKPSGAIYQAGKKNCSPSLGLTA